jgi:hypothetical protein
MSEWSPLDEDVLLTGTLLVRVRRRADGRPVPNRRVAIRGCGFA